MTIRRKLQLVYVLIMLSTVGIGALAVWSVASWQEASESLTYSHVQGERLERVRGDIYRQVKEVIDWLTLEDKDADEEFRGLAAVIAGELGTLEAENRSAEERLAIQNLRTSYSGLVSFAQSIFENPGANRPKMPWLEEKIESQLFPELERHIETLRVYYREEAAAAIQRTQRVQQLTRGLSVVIVLLSLVQGGILLFGIQRWLVWPLARIGRSTTIISTGNFEHRVVRESHDEMGDLARSINRMARELRENQTRLVQSERLAALGELVSYIAHNIRNPLASIRAASQVGQQEVLDSREAFQDVIATVDRLESWVQNLLSYMQPLSLNLVPDDLNRLVRNAVAMFPDQAVGQGPQLVLDLHPLPPVGTDAQWAEQVLVAVIANAIEASSPDGQVFVISRVKQETAAIEVRDEGLGVAKDIQDKVFEPYFTTKPDGVGLGLAMAKKVMNAHQGTIELHSEEGRGTTVTLCYPLPPSQEA